MRIKFLDTWQEFDPEATGFISRDDFRDFLLHLGEPLGFKKAISRNREAQDAFIEALELQLHNDESQYAFVEVLDKVSLRLLVIEQAQKIKDEQEDVEKEHSKEKALLHRKLTQNQAEMLAADESAGIGKRREEVVRQVSDEANLKTLQIEMLKEIKDLAANEHKGSILVVKEMQKMQGATKEGHFAISSAIMKKKSSDDMHPGSGGVAEAKKPRKESVKAAPMNPLQLNFSQVAGARVLEELSAREEKKEEEPKLKKGKTNKQVKGKRLISSPDEENGKHQRSAKSVKTQPLYD